MSAQPIRIHLLRHGRVASHRGDVPVTEAGLAEVEAAGRRLAGEMSVGEVVHVLYAPTRRSRETAETLHAVLSSLNGERRFDLRGPEEEGAIRNPDVYLGGLRVEMVSNAEAMAEQTRAAGIGPEVAESVAFYHTFFRSPDRIGYWVTHPDPPGEDARAVARRIMTFCRSLADPMRVAPPTAAIRYLCVTHSPILRAFLRCYLLPEDPGEPEFVESVDVILPDERSVVLRFREHEREQVFAG